ncbi:hypothetical protein XAP6164_3970001 [Xanthomonas phaseoli pv. phaseoli]|nr:hypothetical protein XAP6164_3970001 [Xanthomonas phaseoli pv. phaseoli]
MAAVRSRRRHAPEHMPRLRRSAVRRVAVLNQFARHPSQLCEAALEAVVMFVPC